MHVPTLSSTRLIWLFVAMVLAMALLAGAETARLAANPVVNLPLNDRPLGNAVITGSHDTERDARGRYRWTAGTFAASFTAPGAPQAVVLRIGLGPGAPDGPSELSATVGSAPPLAFAIQPQPRSYWLLLPPGVARAGELLVRLDSATVTLPGDPRPLGVRLERLEARGLSSGPLWPSPELLLFQAATLAALGLIGLRIGLPTLATGGLVVGLAVALALIPGAFPAVAASYLTRLAVAAWLLAALTLAALPLLERRPAWLGPPEQARALWGIAMVACGVRLAGALFPPFAAYDLNLNLGRLMATVGGALVARNESFEFGGAITVYPSGPYLVLMPGMLAGLSPKLAVQGGISLLDGLATLAVAALARTLGLSGRGTAFAALAYAAVPVALTTLYYGHTAQAFGQALMAPLAVALLLGLRGGRDPRTWIAAFVLFSMALLSHIGVTILALAWLGLAWLALSATRRLGRDTWRQLTLTLVAGGLAGLIFVYGPAVASHLQAVTRLNFGGDGVAPAPAYNLIAKAWWIAYSPVGLLLAAVALPLVPWRRLPLGAAELLGAWVGAVLLFWAVEMLTGLQVRYLVFLTPLACVLAGLALDRLASLRLPGRLAAWATAWGLVAWGAWIWLPGAFGILAPSMVVLLR